MTVGNPASERKAHRAWPGLSQHDARQAPTATARCPKIDAFSIGRSSTHVRLGPDRRSLIPKGTSAYHVDRLTDGIRSLPPSPARRTARDRRGDTRTDMGQVEANESVKQFASPVFLGIAIGAWQSCGSVVQGLPLWNDTSHCLGRIRFSSLGQ